MHFGGVLFEFNSFRSRIRGAPAKPAVNVTSTYLARLFVTIAIRKPAFYRGGLK